MAASAQGTPGTGFEDVRRDGNRVAGAEERPGRRLPSGVESGGSTCKNGTGPEVTFHELVLTSVREDIGPRGYFPDASVDSTEVRTCGPAILLKHERRKQKSR